ncbi:MAG: EamA family transporter [Flavobacteriaceae bacterium]|nr:EamA family transporter [Flavobacteriaceae bacterium]
MNSRNFAFLLAFLAAIIYGISFTVAKEVMPQYVKPYGFILLRVSGATLVFWILSLFLKKEKISLHDYLRIFIASIFGITLNMLAFFKGLSMTTPINASVIMVTSPIIVLTFATIFLKEKATKRKLIGIFIGMFGAILLIMYGRSVNTATNATLGNLLVFVNASSYALYLILIKNLTKKYHPLTLAKWLYLFGLILVIPFGYHEFNEIDWMSLPKTALYRIGFIVLFTTVLTYMFNLIAIKKLKPTTLSIFIYLQPVLASTYALFVGSDSLNEIKIVATILIFIGVYLVTRKPKDEDN